MWDCTFMHISSETKYCSHIVPTNVNHKLYVHCIRNIVEYYVIFHTFSGSNSSKPKTTDSMCASSILFSFIMFVYYFLVHLVCFIHYFVLNFFLFYIYFNFVSVFLSRNSTFFIFLCYLALEFGVVMFLDSYNFSRNSFFGTFILAI